MEAALYSVNKRAKNWRDKKLNLRDVRHCAGSEWIEAEKKENEMYERKLELLKYLAPSAIHKESAGYELLRVYDSDTVFESPVNSRRLQVVSHGNEFDWEEKKEVNYADCLDVTKPTFRFYLLYRTQGRSFHQPVTEDEAKKYKVPVEKIPELKTEGNPENMMVHIQFVDDLIKLLKSGRYTFL